MIKSGGNQRAYKGFVPEMSGEVVRISYGIGGKAALKTVIISVDAE